MENVADSTRKQRFVERRKHERFKVLDIASAFVSYRFPILGQIIDVSTGGLAFSYVAGRERTHRKSQLHILSADGNFSSDKLPFEAVWDSEIPRGYSFGDVSVRHCGVQFGDLDDDQRFELSYFIQNSGTAPEEV